MKRLSATSAALTAAALTAAVALPAAASHAETSVSGTGNGGASATPPPAGTTTTTDQRAQTANYKPVKATWYGPGFYGHRTACGGRLTHHTLGVAHKRLPCGTNVALRYQGRTVVVPVIDRGPYARGVDYDLTYATARSLGMRKTSRLGAAALDG